MTLKISHDLNAPTAAVELLITKPLGDYDLVDVEAAVPREVDPILASQGFKDLLDEARAILDVALVGSGLEVAQLTGAICADGSAYRPGIWLVLRETTASANRVMSPQASARVAAVAQELRTHLGLS